MLKLFLRIGRKTLRQQIAAKRNAITEALGDADNDDQFEMDMVGGPQANVRAR